jgi:hypothetical protein
VLVLLAAAEAGAATLKAVRSAAVHADRSQQSPVLAELEAGEAVVPGLSIASAEGCWTAVTYQGIRGFLPCETLERPPMRDAALADRERDAVIDALLDLSGVRRQIAEITDERQFAALFGGRENHPEIGRLHRILADSFRPEEFYVPLREHLRLHFAVSRAPELLYWLRSPLSRRVVDLEVQAASPEARRQLAEYAEKLRRAPASQRRLNLVQRLDSALRSSEFRVEMAMVLIREVATALAPGGSLSESSLQSLRADFWKTAHDGALLHFLFAYRSLPDEELEEYVRFWESDRGRWFPPVLHQGFLTAIRAVAQNLLRNLQRLGDAGGRPVRRPAG